VGEETACLGEGELSGIVRGRDGDGEREDFERDARWLGWDEVDRAEFSEKKEESSSDLLDGCGDGRVGGLVEVACKRSEVRIEVLGEENGVFGGIRVWGGTSTGWGGG
jgi:hypothetical protein